MNIYQVIFVIKRSNPEYHSQTLIYYITKCLNTSNKTGRCWLDHYYNDLCTSQEYSYLNNYHKMNVMIIRR